MQGALNSFFNEKMKREDARLAEELSQIVQTEDQPSNSGLKAVYDFYYFLTYLRGSLRYEIHICNAVTCPNFDLCIVEFEEKKRQKRTMSKENSLCRIIFLSEYWLQ